MRQMSLWIGTVVVLAVCACIRPAFAAKVLQGQVVFYDPKIVVFGSEFLKVGSRELKVRFASRENALNVQMKQLASDTKAFQGKSKTMSVQQRRQESDALGKREATLRNRRNDLIRESNMFKRFLDEEMTGMLKVACRDLSKETGCTAVLDTGRTNVMFLSSEADVSMMLRRKVDAVWARRASGFVFPK